MDGRRCAQPAVRHGNVVSLQAQHNRRATGLVMGPAWQHQRSRQPLDWDHQHQQPDEQHAPSRPHGITVAQPGARTPTGWIHTRRLVRCSGRVQSSLAGAHHRNGADPPAGQRPGLEGPGCPAGPCAGTQRWRAGSDPATAGCASASGSNSTPAACQARTPMTPTRCGTPCPWHSCCGTASPPGAGPAGRRGATAAGAAQLAPTVQATGTRPTQTRRQAVRDHRQSG